MCVAIASIPENPKNAEENQIFSFQQ